VLLPDLILILARLVKVVPAENRLMAAGGSPFWEKFAAKPFMFS
jgi:hypothetical protein